MRSGPVHICTSIPGVLTLTDPRKYHQDKPRRDDWREDVENTIDGREPPDDIREEVIDHAAKERTPGSHEECSPEITGKRSAEPVHKEKREGESDHDITDANREINSCHPSEIPQKPDIGNTCINGAATE